MNPRLMFTITAVAAAVFGVGFLLFPGTLLLFFGVTDKTVAAEFISRFLGGALISAGVALWFAKEVDESAQKTLGFGMLAGAVGGFVLSVIGVMSSTGVLRSNGWILITLFALFGLGYVYVLFLQPAGGAKPRGKGKK